MTKLLPCPFCGGEAQTVLADTYPHRGMLHSWFVACKDSECGCELGFYGMDENGTCGTYGTEAEAIEAWNTRAGRVTVYPNGEQGITVCGKTYVPERACKPLGTIRHDYEGGYAGFEYETELSCGHKWRDAYGDYPEYCPSCGAKVVEQ